MRRTSATRGGVSLVRALGALSAGAIGFGALTSCSDAGEDGSIDLSLGGGFSGRVEEGDRLVIEGSGGRVLLDGLSYGLVFGEEPPLVGFATRDVSTTYEMQFGAFKPTISPHGPWRVARKLTLNDGVLTLSGGDDETLATLKLSTPEEGHLVAELAPVDLPDAADPARATKLSWGFQCNGGDHFAGFGAQSLDVDHRGQTVFNFVSEQGIGKSETDDYLGLWMLQGQRHSSQAPIPEYLSSRGYVLVAETDRRTDFALCSERASAARIQVDLPATIHLFDGPTPPQAIDRATSTFGRPRMPPLVAFAPWLDAVFGSENVRRVAQKLRDEGIPSSVIWTEDWKGGEWEEEKYSLSEEWEVDRTLYPDFEAMAEDLHAAGFDLHVYFNSFVYTGTKAFDETAAEGLLVQRPSGEPYLFTGAKFSDTGLLDLENPAARAWAKSKMQAAIELGADGWMNDFAEWLPTDGVTYSGPSYAVHNTYPVRWQEVAREAIDEKGEGTSRLFFSRSGWLGSPPLVDVFWAGDQRTTFDRDDGLPTIVPLGIGLGLVGLSTYGHDIAGYQSANNPGSTKELYFRWTELGAWSPVMRTHHGAQPKKEWSWEQDPETIDHFRRYARLHMALVPTLAGLAAEASATGLPMWRGLMIHYPADPMVWPITDEVLLGEHLLVAPVVEAGATSRDVYLPIGRWYPWDGGAALEGGRVVKADAAVTEIPVFAHAGAIVPMFPEGVMTLVRGSAEVPDASSVGDDRVVRVFLGASGSFTEESGLAYTLDSLGDSTSGSLEATFAPDGGTSEALSACPSTPVAPCAQDVGEELVLHVEGPGVVGFRTGGAEVARFTASGGAADRALTLRVRR